MVQPKGTAATAADTLDEPSIIDIDPDFAMPAQGELMHSYVRAMRIVFPRAS